MKHSEYYVIGLMSGSSLDGLDLAYVRFYFDEKWDYELLASKTAELGLWEHKLRDAVRLSGKELEALSIDFAVYLATEVEIFIRTNQISKLDLLVSHGHTIYHYPDRGSTCQIGDGRKLSELLGVQVVNNLRQADIDAGGQGAPIVPIGDLFLFSEYEYCLNLGGIANISSKIGGELYAYDICSANQVLNHFANLLDLPYDEGGSLARSGQLNQELLSALNDLSYYQKLPPKSLDNSFTREVLAVIDLYEIAIPDILASYVEHIAMQISRVLGPERLDATMLITGGGAFNTFLVERISALCHVEVHVPESEIVNYKEAIVMGFIGVLRLRNEVNVRCSVTGATKDTCCGDIHGERLNLYLG